MDWRIPAAMITGHSLPPGFFTIDPDAYPAPLFALFSGGLTLGNVHGIDMVASPVTPAGGGFGGASSSAH